MTLQPMSRPKSMGQLAEDLESLLRTWPGRRSPQFPRPSGRGPGQRCSWGWAAGSSSCSSSCFWGSWDEKVLPWQSARNLIR